MSAEHHESPAPHWWTPPGETDSFAYVGLAILLMGIFGLLHLYARFDRYAEHKAQDTPLRTTVPTLLAVALAYEMLPPLRHFSALLPLSLIAVALARDIMLWQHHAQSLVGEPAPESPAPARTPARTPALAEPAAADRATPAPEPAPGEARDEAPGEAHGEAHGAKAPAREAPRHD